MSYPIILPKLYENNVYILKQADRLNATTSSLYIRSVTKQKRSQTYYNLQADKESGTNEVEIKIKN